MKFFLLVMSLGIGLGLQAQVAPDSKSDTSASITKIYIVRHADRAGSADSLTEAGVARAKELTHVLSQTDLGKIYSTNTNRTKNTAKPIAELKGINVELYSDNASLLTRLDKSKTSLVVGHSNTLGDLIRKCGCNPPVALNALPETQYDNLFLVMLSKATINGIVTTKCDYQQLKYGPLTN